jgi:hypothetical protein
MASYVTFKGSLEDITELLGVLASVVGDKPMVANETYRVFTSDDSAANWSIPNRTYIGYGELCAINTRAIIGAEINKKFKTGIFKGYVQKLRSNGYYHVVYEDGDSEDMTEDEIREYIYEQTPPSMCDVIEWIESSGNKAQSFAKVCRAIVKDRSILAPIFENVVGVKIRYDYIGPDLWAKLGECENDKLYWAKRVIEAIYAAV